MEHFATRAVVSDIEGLRRSDGRRMTILSAEESLVVGENIMELRTTSACESLLDGSKSPEKKLYENRLFFTTNSTPVTYRDSSSGTRTKILVTT